MVGGHEDDIAKAKSIKHRAALRGRAIEELHRHRDRAYKLTSVRERLELRQKLSGKGGRGVKKIVVGAEASPYEDEEGGVGGVAVYQWRQRRSK